MFKTYISIAYRNFIRNRVFSIINVLGLSIGISASLVIFLIVHYDFNFDKFESDRAHLYRVVTESKFYGNTMHTPGVPSPLADAVKKEVSGISEVIAFHQFNGNGKVSIREKPGKKWVAFKNQQQAIILADRSYFKMVPYQWIAGSAEKALEDPFHLVLTEKRARLYFPNISFTEMIGKQVVYDDSIVVTVTGIVKNLSENSDFIFSDFISHSTITANSLNLQRNYTWTSWGSINSGSLLFIRTVSPGTAESQIQSLEKKYDKDANANSIRNFKLQPFDDIHFSSVYPTFGDHSASKPVLYGLLAVAAFLLALACINFINLTTAQSVRRAKEIGVRKTLGSSGKQLIIQFLTETFFISLISLILSIIITPLLLKIFSDFIPADLHFDILHQPHLIIFGVILTISVTILAGFYPALVLSRFKPVLVLKNQAYGGAGGNRKALLRKGLTISQFLIAQAFTMATLIAVRQIHFVMNKDMGFKKDAIITVYTPFEWDRSRKSNPKRLRLEREINKLPGVELTSLGNDPPAADGWSSNSMKYKDAKKEIEIDVRQKNGDTNYLKLYHIRLLAGRNVRASDTANEYVINETCMHMLGIQKPEDVLNKNINDLPIVGVMADFNEESLHTTIKPAAFSCESGNSWILHIALNQQEVQTWKSTIASIQKLYMATFPDEDFTYHFLDENIAKFYKSEQNLSSLLKWASVLAISISCMGLLGLVMFTTNQRTKEIGVRKVLGASVTNIVSILSKDFIQLVLIASFIAMPLAWWGMNKWLQNFAYKAPISWWLFALSVLFMIGIALLTLSIQTIRAANANPVDSLRTE